MRETFFAASVFFFVLHAFGHEGHAVHVPRYADTGGQPGSREIQSAYVEEYRGHRAYMHDGSVPTLEAALDHYRGAENSNKSEFVKRFSFSVKEKADLLAFVRSLTDEKLLTDPRPGIPGPRNSPNGD